jgi:hypothetical protein
MITWPSRTQIAGLIVLVAALVALALFRACAAAVPA